MKISRELIETVKGIAVEAGEEIMKVYHSDSGLKVYLKADQTPVTIADRASNNMIVKRLLHAFPNIPILSEEEAAVPYEARKEWEYYWCVDPLDGTKEFINHRDEFTVNIALIHRNKSILGVIYAPAFDALYYGANDLGSYGEKSGGMPVQINAEANAKEWIAIGSRSHASAEETDMLKSYPISKILSVGSSLKFCRIAEGAAHIYYRHGPTMEWDTAAGQAIAENSGAIMTTPDGQEFRYNKPSLRNGGFICKVR